MFIFRLHKHLVNRNTILSRCITYLLQLNGNSATEKLGSKFSSIIKQGDNVLLYGDIGVGKTSFSRGLIKSYYNSPELFVTSPTFMLDNEYAVENKKFHHLDLYRLKSYTDCLSLDIISLFESNNIVLVEWSEKLGNNLPSEHIKVKMKLNKNSENRDVEISIYPNIQQSRLDEWIESINKESFIKSINKC